MNRSTRSRACPPLAGRRGIALVGGAVLLVVLIPFLALVVDLGLALVAHRQMQTAAESGALEGLRLRDVPGLSPEDRRAKVRTLIRGHFDDDLDLDDGEGELRLGAGPVVDFAPAEGVSLPGTDFVASRRIVGISAWKPDPQPNLSDERHGDMLAGQYGEGAGHVEGADYFRDDLRLPGDADYDGSVGDDTFLVRLRRTGGASALDDVPGTSSTGPTVPSLFGRGTIGPPELLDRRERGTIVRSTAIARAAPVVSVGVPSAEIDHGLATFRVSRSAWEPLEVDVPQVVDLHASGTITGGILGEFVVRRVVVLGDVLAPAGAVPPDVEDGRIRLVPITAPVGTAERIVAFGLGRLESTAGAAPWRFVKLRTGVAWANASAAFLGPVAPNRSEFLQVWNLFGTTGERAAAPAPVRSVR